MVSVSCAVLLRVLESPSTVLLTVAVLVAVTPLSGRLMTMSTLAVSPGSSTPPFCVQRSAALAVLQVKVAVLPAETVTATGLLIVAPVKPITL